ncbi:uncharacterized protein H6S33_000195 [Morchella sextelata]|uniref:uncharacterized protein n=1 Tax=Morchella sextelata TaxID=1174677 RepID=UPI001D03A83F|nr:uncharacterized protein H6S33_000195 [Morchella sextelata]KAH0614559.1 hypothetical protein H6S33_000195 [Morchella sextelata]
MNNRVLNKANNPLKNFLNSFHRIFNSKYPVPLAIWAYTNWSGLLCVRGGGTGKATEFVRTKNNPNTNRKETDFCAMGSETVVPASLMRYNFEYRAFGAIPTRRGFVDIGIATENPPHLRFSRLLCMINGITSSEERKSIIAYSTESHILIYPGNIQLIIAKIDIHPSTLAPDPPHGMNDICPYRSPHQSLHVNTHTDALHTYIHTYLHEPPPPHLLANLAPTTEK